MSNLGVTLDILNQKGTPAFYSDIFTNRPAAGFAGRVFISTDTGAIYEDTGSTWTLIADATGVVTTPSLQSVTTVGNTTTQGIVISAGNLAIGTATAGAPLDIHTTTGTAAQFNGTGVNNAYAFFQNAGVSKWRIGNYYNGGTNQFTIYNNAAAVTQLVMDSGATTLIGNFTATTLVKSGGTSAQFLKADGSVDSNTYLTTGSASSTYLPLAGGTLTGGLSGTSASFSSSVTGLSIVKSGGTSAEFLKADGSVDSNTYITTNTSQTIAAGITKTWNNEMRFGLGTMYDNTTGVALATGFTTINAGLTGSNTFLQVWRSNAYKLTFNCDLTSNGSTFTLPANQSNALIATATGTSSQLIAGDGTLISAGTNITISGGTISASGGGGGMAIGGSITSATAGSVLYAGASGVLAQSNANFYYDYTNNRLGLGTTSPQVQLSVVSTGDNYGLFIGPNAGGTSGKRLKLGYYSTGNYSVIQSINDGTATTSLILQKDGGNVGIGTTTADSELVINGSTSSRFNFKAGNTRYGTFYSDSGLLAISTITAIPLVFGINDVEKMRLSSSFNLLIGTSTDSGYKLDVQGTIRATGNLTAANVLSGTYTPTITAGTNCAAVTAFTCQYMRVGSVVTVSGKVYGSATATNTETQFTMTVPVNSNFASVEQCGGTGRSAEGGVAPSGAGYVAYVQAVSANTVRFSYTAPAVLGTGGNFWFSFTYLIV
jgi:hypothetical protein